MGQTLTITWHGFLRILNSITPVSFYLLQSAAHCRCNSSFCYPRGRLCMTVTVKVCCGKRILWSVCCLCTENSIIQCLPLIRKQGIEHWWRLYPSMEKVSCRTCIVITQRQWSLSNTWWHSCFWIWCHAIWWRIHPRFFHCMCTASLEVLTVILLKIQACRILNVT